MSDIVTQARQELSLGSHVILKEVVAACRATIRPEVVQRLARGVKHTLCAAAAAHLMSTTGHVTRSDRAQAKKRLLKHRKKLAKEVAAYNEAVVEFNQALEQPDPDRSDALSPLPVLPPVKQLKSVADLPAGFPAAVEPLKRNAVFAYMEYQRLNEEIATINEYDLPQLALVMAHRRAAVMRSQYLLREMLRGMEKMLDSPRPQTPSSPTSPLSPTLDTPMPDISETAEEIWTQQCKNLQSIIVRLLEHVKGTAYVTSALHEIDSLVHRLHNSSQQGPLRQAYALVSGLNALLTTAVHTLDRVRASGWEVVEYRQATSRYESVNGVSQHSIPSVMGFIDAVPTPSTWLAPSNQVDTDPHGITTVGGSETGLNGDSDQEESDDESIAADMDDYDSSSADGGSSVDEEELLDMLLEAVSGADQ